MGMGAAIGTKGALDNISMSVASGVAMREILSRPGRDHSSDRKP